MLPRPIGPGTSFPFDEDGHDLGGGLLRRDLCRVVQQRHGDADLLVQGIHHDSTGDSTGPVASSGPDQPLPGRKGTTQSLIPV